MAIFEKLLLLFLFLCISCVSEIKVVVQSEDEDTEVLLPSISLGEINLSSPDLSKNVFVTLPFVGDSNNNSIIRLYFCSIKASAGCDPLAGESITLKRSGDELIGTINISSSILTPGDFLKYELVSQDADGVVGAGNESGFILIPYDGSIPKVVRYIDKYYFGGGDLNSGADDTATSMVKGVDNSLYVGGYTRGNLGEINSGDLDAVIIKFLSNGKLDEKFGNKGIFQLGAISSIGDASANDSITSLAIDNEGFIYAAGYTESSLGGTLSGAKDGFVLKINGTTGKLERTFGQGDGADGDGIVQINDSNTADASGNDEIYGILYDGENSLYLTGNSASPLGGASGGSLDGFVIKLNKNTGLFDSSFGNGDGSNSDGIVQFNNVNTNSASGTEYVKSMMLRQNSIFIAGETNGSIGGTNGGGRDAFVIKLDKASGSLDSDFGDGDGIDNDGILQFNSSNAADTSSDERVYCLVLDQGLNAYVGGNTRSDMGGINSGNSSVFIGSFNVDSGLLDSSFGDGDGSSGDGIVLINDTNAISANSYDTVNSLALDGAGNLILAGNSSSDFTGTNSGGQDGFVIKLNKLSGLFDTSFGGGDGNSGDGILLFNAINANSANQNDYTTSVQVLSNGLFVAGSTSSAFGGRLAGEKDIFVAKLNLDSGILNSNFGSGDGIDNDGIFQINNLEAGNVFDSEYFRASVYDNEGNLYIGGSTRGTIGGSNCGGVSAFVMKIKAATGKLDTNFGSGDGINNDGIFQLNKLNALDSCSNDEVTSIELDASGNLYVAGYTSSSLGGNNAGANDGFVFKMNSVTGELVTSFGNGDGRDGDGIRQINPVNASNFDRINALHVNGGSLFLVGETRSNLGGFAGGGFENVVIIKLSAVTGEFDSSFGDGDGVDNDGIVLVNNVNAADHGSADYIDTIISNGSGDLFIAGSTISSLGGLNTGGVGRRDGFVIKLSATTGIFDSDFGDGDGADNDGVLQFNMNNTADSTNHEYVKKLFIDGSNRLVVVGHTSSGLSGAVPAGYNAFIIWVDQDSGIFDTTLGDGDGVDNDGILQVNFSVASSTVFDASIDSNGDIYVSGQTYGDFGGPSAGSGDSYILKINGSSGLIDNSFGNGDGVDNDGVIQFNSVNGLGTTDTDYMFSINIDGGDNIFGAGHSLFNGYTDGFLYFLPAGSDGV